MPYIDWNMSPTYRLYRGIRLFFAIVWRPWDIDYRIGFFTAISVAYGIHKDRPFRCWNDFRLIKPRGYWESPEAWGGKSETISKG
jgi:hypothetical protein